MKLCAGLAVSVLLFAPAGVLHAQSDAASSSASLPIVNKTEVPGTSLSPGSYTIRLADHLKDRILIEIQKAGSNKPAVFLAYPSFALSQSGSTGPITYNKGLKNKPTLRGFTFPGGLAVEFVYPKKDAVTLAKENNVQVVAVDPSSENLPALPDLTPTDRQIVSLWMLTPTPIQPGESKPGIAAARYQPPASASNQASQQAAASTPPVPALPEASSSHRTASAPPKYSARPTSPAPVQVARNERPRLRAQVKELPHTASNLPILWLAGGLSLLLALALRVGAWRTRSLRNHA